MGCSTGSTPKPRPRDTITRCGHVRGCCQPRSRLDASVPDSAPTPERRARAQGARQLAADREGLLPPRRPWPDEPEIVEQVPIRSCQRRGVAIDLVLDRPRENRSQLVFTRIQGGREGIFWQSARTTRQARPGIRVPRRRAAELAQITILVDTRERYASNSPNNKPHRATSAGRRRLRHHARGPDRRRRRAQSLDDLVRRLIDGQLTYAIADRPRSLAPPSWSGPLLQPVRLEYAKPGFVTETLPR